MQKISYNIVLFSKYLNNLLNSQINNHDEEFIKANKLLLINRIKIASMTLLVLYVYLFYVDFIQLHGIQKESYRINLTTIHVFGLVMSIAFLLSYKRIMNEIKRYQSKWPYIIINIYISFYALSGACLSINSQLSNGNIDAYLIILIAISALFPINPKHFFFVLLISHILFLIGVSNMAHNDLNDLFSKQINSTGTVVVAFIIDVSFYSLRKKDFHNQLNIKHSQQNLLELFHVNPYPLTLTNLNSGRILLANNEALAFYHVTEQELATIDPHFFYKHEGERAKIIDQLLKTGSVENYMVEQKFKDGSIKWVIVNYKLMDYMNEKCILAGSTDITELKKIEQELEKHATTDILTGVLNRRKGMELLERILVAAKEENLEFVLLFVDVNNLKKVNDGYGHPEGDFLVKTVSEVMKSQLNEGDLIFRFGGDEFILVFKYSIEYVENIWSDIQRTLDEVNDKNQKPYRISVSHDLFHYHSNQNMSLQEIIHYADHEMYKDKARNNLETTQYDKTQKGINNIVPKEVSHNVRE
ncbi:sensor domain-containing diguanylate cyclase [Heyndrickxia ginsengihumi]|uniref:sensor domain-containing diguanylate cyclase n=1 Tax=Heyndrickxia ginsengihumi TaxID=363870 RepID=UPI00203CFF81|nr:sensor domain-containing diguanylate cyclase [Heyndrickxia ginsengihumi]MCM3024711.1 sensor domain-containing diguanylate cyclase [Heyndrickxia ginsengihumi]